MVILFSSVLGWFTGILFKLKLRIVWKCQNFIYGMQNNRLWRWMPPNCNRDLSHVLSIFLFFVMITVNLLYNSLCPFVYFIRNFVLRHLWMLSSLLFLKLKLNWHTFYYFYVWIVFVTDKITSIGCKTAGGDIGRHQIVIETFPTPLWKIGCHNSQLFFKILKTGS